MEKLDAAIRQIFNAVVKRSPDAAKPLFEKLRDANEVMVTGTTAAQTKAAYAEYQQAKSELELLAEKDKVVAEVLDGWKKDVRAAKEKFWRHYGPVGD